MLFRGVSNVLAVASLALFLFLSKDNHLSDGMLYQWGFSLVEAMSAAMILSAIVNPNAVFTKCLEWPWLRYTGKISYGLYLWHVPILQMHNKLNPAVHSIIGLITTYIVAAFSFRYWESPFLRLKSRIGYPRYGMNSSTKSAVQPNGLVRTPAASESPFEPKITAGPTVAVIRSIRRACQRRRRHFSHTPAFSTLSIVLAGACPGHPRLSSPLLR